MLEGLICPVCENTIDEIDLRESLKCPNCSVDLKDRKYLDFIEFEYNKWKTKTKFKIFNIDINRSDFKNDHSVFLNFLNLFFKH